MKHIEECLYCTTIESPCGATKFYLNASGASVTHHILFLILLRSGISWEMHPAQLFAIEKQAMNFTMNSPVEVAESTVTAHKEIGPECKYTLCGLPIKLRQDYPMSLIRLMLNDKELTRIEALGIPLLFCNGADLQNEREKFQKIVFGNDSGETYAKP